MAEQGDGSKVDPPQRPDRRQIMGVGAAGGAQVSATLTLTLLSSLLLLVVPNTTTLRSASPRSRERV